MNDLSIYILAGGESKRLGYNKALAEIEGRKVISIIADRIRGISDNTFLSANTPQEFSFLGLETIPDIKKNIGPLGGIHSCLTHSKSENNFFISCDMPFISNDVINRILQHDGEERVVIASNQGKLEFMCGLYKKSVLPVIEEILKEEAPTAGSKTKKFSMWNLVHSVGYKSVEFNDEKSKTTFMNLNSEEDLRMIRSLAREDKALIG